MGDGFHPELGGPEELDRWFVDSAIVGSGGAYEAHNTVPKVASPEAFYSRSLNDRPVVRSGRGSSQLSM